MSRVWAIDAYRARMDSAIDAERCDEVDRVRIAAKRRLLEMISSGRGEEDIAAARDVLAQSYERLRLTHRVALERSAQTMAAKLSADAETAAIASEQAPLPRDTARDVKERIMQILSSGNCRPWSTSDLAKEAERRIETVARAVSQLRAERKITSRRIGRNVLHRVAASDRELWRTNLHATNKMPIDKHEDFLTSVHHPGVAGLKGASAEFRFPMSSSLGRGHRVAKGDLSSDSDQASSFTNEGARNLIMAETTIHDSMDPALIPNKAAILQGKRSRNYGRRSNTERSRLRVVE